MINSPSKGLVIFVVLITVSLRKLSRPCWNLQNWVVMFWHRPDMCDVTHHKCVKSVTFSGLILVRMQTVKQLAKKGLEQAQTHSGSSYPEERALGSHTQLCSLIQLLLIHWKNTEKWGNEWLRSAFMRTMCWNPMTSEGNMWNAEHMVKHFTDYFEHFVNTVLIGAI